MGRLLRGGGFLETGVCSLCSFYVTDYDCFYVKLNFLWQVMIIVNTMYI